MDDLPAPIVVEILSRVGDSTDLAWCRLASKTLRSLSYDVRAVSLVCSRERFVRSRAPETRSLTVPFKSVVASLASLLRGRHLESLSLAVEDLDAAAACCEFDESDDLHLTAVDFVSQWLPGIGGRLKSLSISDLWVQSCWRPSEVLTLISNCCERLLTLELRNAWLSVNTLQPMLSLSSLTLEFIRLEDEDLDNLSACFPSLESLNLIGVGGLNEPKIRLPHLKTCRWTVSHVPVSVAIHAPNLTDLDLTCISPRVLSLSTPSLRRLHLKTKQIGVVEMDRFVHLRSVRVECSSGLRVLVRALVGCEAVEKAEVEAPVCADGPLDLHEPVSMADLADAFPHLKELGLGPGAWRELEWSTAGGAHGVPSEWRCQRRLTVYLPRTLLFWFSSLSSVLGVCGPLCEVVMLVHGGDAGETMDRLVSMCRGSFPEIRWRWGCGGSASKGRFWICVDNKNPCLLGLW